MASTDSLPIVLIPGLTDSPRLYQAQLPALFRLGPVMVADHTRDDSIAGIASRVLRHAPPRFALAGMSMGGYTALEILRQAPERVERLALIDTSARPDTPEARERRAQAIAAVAAGKYPEVVESSWPLMVHDSRVDDAALKQTFLDMHLAVGPEVYTRQQQAIMGRVDSRPSLGAIRCPTLVLVGEGDKVTPPSLAEEMAHAIAGSRLRQVPRAGHLTPLEQPEAVTEALLAWLTED